MRISLFLLAIVAAAARASAASAQVPPALAAPAESAVPISRRPGRAQREPGPMNTGWWSWVPACAGTTRSECAHVISFR